MSGPKETHPGSADRFRLVGEGFRDAARHTPERPAVVRGTAVWRYDALAAAVDCCAAGFHDLGFKRGDRVVLCLPNCAEYLIAFLAAAAGGFVAVTLDPATAPVARLHTALAQIRPRAVLATTAAEDMRAAVAAAGATLVLVGASSPTTEATPVSAAAAASVLTWRRLLAAAPREISPPAASDPFYVGYTSGTGGRPKGVVRQHCAWTRSFAAACTEFGLAPGDRFLVPGPLHYSAPLFFALLTLSIGGTLLLDDHFAARAVAARLKRREADAALMVPSMYRAVSEVLSATSAGHVTDATGFHPETADEPGKSPHEDRDSCANGSGPLLISCGENLAPKLRATLTDRLPGARVCEFYGSSEIGFTTILTPEIEPADGSVGRAFGGVEVAIRRADGSPAACGETGLLWARSEMMAQGYDLGPGCTEAWREGAGWDGAGWATAGDLAWIGADGLLRLAGRADRTINRGGVKIRPEEIEAVLATHVSVAEAAVLGIPDPHRGEEVVAAVALRAKAVLGRSELQAYCRARLAPGRRPRRILILPRLPRLANGKVAYQELLQRCAPRRPSPRS